MNRERDKKNRKWERKTKGIHVGKEGRKEEKIDKRMVKGEKLDEQKVGRSMK